MDPVLLNKGGLSMEEGLLVCHFLEYAARKGTYPAQSVAVVTTHYTQMVWLKHCVASVGRKWQSHHVNLLSTVATLDRFQGLQAPVILASLPSKTPGIMHDIFGGSTGPKYLTDGVPSNIWWVYRPQIFDGTPSVKYLGAVHPPNI